MRGRGTPPSRNASRIRMDICMRAAAASCSFRLADLATGNWQLTNPRNYAYIHPQCNSVISALDASRLGEAIGRYTVYGRLCSIVVLGI